MNNVSHRIKSNDARTLAKFAIAIFASSVFLALLTHLATGFLSFFLGVWTFVTAIAAGIMMFAWGVYIFGSENRSG